MQLKKRGSKLRLDDVAGNTSHVRRYHLRPPLNQSVHVGRLEVGDFTPQPGFESGHVPNVDLVRVEVPLQAGAYTRPVFSST